MGRIAEEKYKELKDMGGRPSREINPNPGPCPPWKSDIDKIYHVRDHWGREVGRLRNELARWLDFRWHQFRMRENSKIFNKYREAVHKHRQEKGIDWTVELQLGQQMKLDEWREYCIYEHRKRRALEKELDRAKRELEPVKERMRKAERNGSVGVPETTFSGRWGELIRYKEKISQAQKEVEMTQKRLEALGVEESLSAVARDLLITQAEEDLESAQKTLEAAKSDELEQLNKEAERKHAQEHLAIAQGKVNWANTRLEQLDTLLEWILGQFAEIATEYASSSWGSQQNRDLLDGWERYYVYMRERLQAKQDKDMTWFIQRGWKRGTEAEEARDDLLFPQERVRPLKALLTWIEREFPEIAAKYALFSQGSQSNDDGQDGVTVPYSKPSPNKPARKASRSDVGKSTRRKGNSARERSALGQVQPSKVSKPDRRGRRPLDQKLGTTCHGVWPPEGRTNDVARVEVQEPPKVAVRRSKRISQRTCDPASPSPGLVRATEKSSQRRPDGPLRRSARILDRTKKMRSLESDLDVKPARSNTTARRKSTRRTTNTTYSGKPQGI
ncbi:hypothetical protein K469DRAFT_51217 [Zopfia rhizophila CBS 207.26]|uniref:Uncharacterized protein n=1 Tax=Zopfia rhizophila CBS 207.26 TaxID=1314779 RepID=A0A6A6EFX2_9PEZI|nr:hypothetical protein K469DRAFT_51217 [Zopfia rhizophila CBS 207.26]